MQKKPHGPKFTAERFTLLKRKNFLQKAQDIILPWRLRIKDLIRDRGAYDRSDIFLIEQARFICQKRCGEDDIRRTGAFVCFIPVEDSAVDKYTAAFGQVYLIGPGKAAYFTFGGNEKINYPGASTQALCSAPTSPLTALAFLSCSRKIESGV